MKFINKKNITETVGTLLPQLGQEGEGVDNNFTDEIQKEVKNISKKDCNSSVCENTEVTMESVQDTIYNYKTFVPIDRTTRKMIYDIYKTEEDIKRAIASGKDKSVITDLKREVVRLRKNFNNTKRGMKSNEVAEIKKIERATISELKKMTYKESVNEDDVIVESFSEFLKKIKNFSFKKVKIDPVNSLGKDDRERIKNVLSLYSKKYKDAPDVTKLIHKKINSKEINNVKDEETRELLKSLDSYFSSNFKNNKGDNYIEYWENDKNEIIFGVVMCGGSGNIFINPKYNKHSSFLKSSLTVVANDYPSDAINWAKVMYKEFNLDVKDMKESVIDSLSALSVNLIQEKADLDEEMKPIVEKLNNKGYKVKYASPGHKNLRKKEDKEPDGMYKGKLYSDARIMFDKEYNMGEAPEGWKWRIVDGCSYLDIKDKTHDPENDKRTPDEIFSEWKKEYMESLEKFVDKLKPNGSSDNKEDLPAEESVDEIINDIMEVYLS